MKERVKSLALVILLAISILLVLLIWGVDLLDMKNNNGNKRSRIFESEALLSDVVMPHRIAINYSPNEHTVIQNPRKLNLWRNSIEVLRQIFEDNNYKIRSREPIDRELYYTFLGQPSVVLDFSGGLNTVTLLNSLGIRETKDFVEDIPNFDKIYISLEKPFVIIEVEGIHTLITLDLLLTENISRGVRAIAEEGYNNYLIGKDLFGGDSLSLIPRVSGHKIEKISFENILSTLDQLYVENIVFSFLGKDVNLVREIKEEGKSTNYIDGTKILKIYDQGLISYYNPDQPATKERNLFISLDTAMEFISQNLGFDDSLYLKEINPITAENYPGYRFTFGKRSSGYQIELDNTNISEYIEIDVFNEHVRRFAQLFRRTKQRNLEYYEFHYGLEVENLIKENYDELAELLMIEELSMKPTYEELLLELKEASIVYLDNGEDENLELAWKIVLKDKILYYDVLSQQLIKGE